MRSRRSKRRLAVVALAALAAIAVLAIPSFGDSDDGDAPRGGGSLRDVRVSSSLGTVRAALVEDCSANVAGASSSVVAPPCRRIKPAPRIPVLPVGASDRTLTVTTGEGAATVSTMPRRPRLGASSFVDADPMDPDRRRWRAGLAVPAGRIERLRVSASPLITDSGHLLFEIRLAGR